MPVLVLIPAAAFAVLLYTIVRLAARWRENAIRALAARTGLHYLGEGLPRSLPLEGDLLGRATKVWNVIDGEPYGLRVMAFDCRFGYGKGSWRRTILAVEKNQNIREKLEFNSELMTDSVGNWSILYQPRSLFRIAGLMPVEQLEAHLNFLAGKSARTPA